jgi:uroporphyrinogen-III synthase
MASAAGILLDVIPFIQIRLKPTNELESIFQVTDLADTVVVFTSVHAVTAVQLFYSNTVFKVYCTAGATREAVLNAFPTATIAGTANNASLLADMMIQHSVSEAIFFCGKSRLDIMPLKLKAAGVHFTEYVVYETEPTGKRTGQYNAVVFFSPSAVASYFNYNIPEPETIIFSIGTTTTDALSKYTTNRIITSHFPDKEKLVMQAIDFLSEQHINI